MTKHSSGMSGQRGYRDRLTGIRDTRDKFLIVCEGAKTEPNYFKCFPISTHNDVVTVIGTGMNTVSLVEKAIELYEPKNHDQVWCVFDRDSFPEGNFSDAITLAKEKGFNVAYSNEAFELWYLLHFNYYDTGITRQKYIEKLSKLLEHRYEKNSKTIYAELRDKQAVAIRNAKRLLAQYVPSIPHKDNPSTTVHKLVEELNRFIP